MLKELFIEHYKSLKDVKVAFKDGLNIIIGKNGSGKSNLLEFMDRFAFNLLLNDSLRPNILPDSNFYYIFASHKSDSCLRVDFSTTLIVDPLSGKSKQASSVKFALLNEHNMELPLIKPYPFHDRVLFDLPKEERSKIHPFVLSGIRTISYSIPDNLCWLYVPNKYQIESKDPLVLSSPDENLSLALNFKIYIQFLFFKDKNKYTYGYLKENLKRILLEKFDEYKESIYLDDNLRLYSPIDSIRINNNVNIYEIENKILIENLTFEFRVEGTWMPWSYLSDGTKRLFYMIAEISGLKDGVVVIEEPELGIHPHQLFKLMDFFKAESHENQIIISTHSPLVLDILDADELDRITVAKIDSGRSQFNKLTEAQKSKAQMYMEEVSDLSYYWLHSDLESDD